MTPEQTHTHFEREFLRHIFDHCERAAPSPDIATEQVLAADVEWFTSEERQLIFTGMSELAQSGTAPADHALYKHMTSQAKAEAVSDEIFACTAHLPHQWPSGGLTTLTTSARRLSQDARTRADEGALDAARVHIRAGDKESAQDRLEAVWADDGALFHNEGGSVRELLAAVMTEHLTARDDGSPPAGIFPAYAGLAEQIGQLYPGSLTILAGNPGDGKSAVMIDMMLRMAVRGTNAAYVSCEDSVNTVQDRLAQKLGVLTRYEPGKMTSGQEKAIDTWYRHELSKRAFVRKPRGSSLQGTLMMMRKCCRVDNAEILFVDYLNKIEVPGLSEYDSVNMILNGIKNEGERLGVPVVLGAQQNRSGRNHKDAKPGYGALRGSGRIEESAENVLVLFRTGEGMSERRHMKVAKAKSGPSGAKWNLIWPSTGEMMKGLTNYDEAQDNNGPKKGNW